MRSPFSRHDGGARTHAHEERRDGVSLAKPAALVIGTTLVVFGLAGLLTNSEFPAFDTAFPDGTAQGETFLGLEVNGWTNWLCIAAGALVLFGLARHWLARTTSLLAGLALAAAAVIALIDGEDVLGLAAANGATKLALGIAAAALLLTALLPRAGRRREKDAGAEHHDRDGAPADRDRRTLDDDDVQWESPRRVQPTGRTEVVGPTDPAERRSRFTRDQETTPEITRVQPGEQGRHG